MKGKQLFLILVALVYSAFCANAESIMELLINKEWYEVDLTKMQVREDYYVKFTGTQRLTVGLDQEGNTKMRVQKYYLSNNETEFFDSTQVGKNKDGKYLVLSGKKAKGYTKAICMKLYQVDEMNLRMGASNQTAAQQHCFVVQSGIEKYNDKEEGTVISTQDLLVGKMWYEVDIKTGKRKRTEVQYEKDGTAIFCTMAENYKRELPDWQMREFYFSDNIEHKFKHSKIGDRENGIYLVVKEKNEQGEWYAANYDITTLSANRLVLDCVYPQGVPTRIFMTRNAIETSHRTAQKPQQWQLTENTWHRLDSTGVNRISFTERFDNVNITRRYPMIKNGIRDTVEISNPYYMSNTADSVFNFDKVGKTYEGDYLVVNERTKDGDRMAVSYAVDYIDSKNMILSMELDSTMHVVAYERDLSKAEVDRGMAEKSDSIKGKTTLDRLSGRQWRFAKRPNPRMSKFERWYFTDSIWATVNFVYDEFKKVWDASIKTRPFYLSDLAHHNFSMDYLKKKYEGGRFINFYVDLKRKVRLDNPPVVLREASKGRPRMLFKPRQAHTLIPMRITHSYEINFLTEWVLMYTATAGSRVYRYTLVSD